jgi:DNA repair protein RadA/Sms
MLASLSDLGELVGQLDAVQPDLLVVDSIQTISAAGVEGLAGGVTQVRGVTAALVAESKARGMSTVLVGHVTKDGAVAGPRTLEHLVDVVCSFEGERHTALRLVRATKNRHGPADEVGCFELGGEGIREIPDPSGLFLAGGASGVPGTCASVSMEGRRPMAVEVQALVAPTQAHNPRRTTAGLDASRLAMVLAVLQRRVRIGLADQEVYVSTVGGARVTEPALDLAVAVACASARLDVAVDPHAVVIGEVGLAGEVRGVRGLERRVAEASRLGFERAIVPVGAGSAAGVGAAAHGLTLIEVADVAGAVRAALEMAAGTSPAAPALEAAAKTMDGSSVDPAGVH